MKIKNTYLVLVLVSLLVLVAGCTAEPPVTPGTGNLVLLVSDAEADIGDFDSLTVHFSKARVFKRGEENGTAFSETDLTGTSVDLTQVVGDNAISVLNVELEEGTYSKIELHVSETEGVVGNETVAVSVPSEKLQIVRPFEIGANQTTEFVFDINVVKKGQTGEYSLQPVIGKSGAVGKDIQNRNVNRVRCTVNGDCPEGNICRNNKCVVPEPEKHELCNENVTAVYSCGNETYRVVSVFMGAGYTIVNSTETILTCPVVAEPSEECENYLNTCSDEDLC
jgi:Cys-rich repeat protein